MASTMRERHTMQAEDGQVGGAHSMRRVAFSVRLARLVQSQREAESLRLGMDWWVPGQLERRPWPRITLFHRDDESAVAAKAPRAVVGRHAVEELWEGEEGLTVYFDRQRLARAIAYGHTFLGRLTFRDAARHAHLHVLLALRPREQPTFAVARRQVLIRADPRRLSLHLVRPTGRNHPWAVVCELREPKVDIDLAAGTHGTLATSGIRVAME
mmetsp:Transcript_19461/g.39769  ORF Transcript_19461/g.39769 Transcript_19461/m.39769 type:complete len:213 (+) Transcript_19461:69-707(+)